MKLIPKPFVNGHVYPHHDKRLERYKAHPESRRKREGSWSHAHATASLKPKPNSSAELFGSGFSHAHRKEQA